MKKQHIIVLDKNRYARVLMGEMNMYLMVDTERAIDVGHILTFRNKDNDERIHARVTGYHAQQSFDEIYKRVDKIRMGYGKNEKADPSDMLKIYTPEQIKKYGARGYVFQIMPEYKTVDEMNEQEIAEYNRELEKHCKKSFKQMYSNLEKTDDLLGFLGSLVKHNHSIYFAETDPLNHDMFKWLVYKHIDECKKFLDAVEQKEKEINYPAHDDYDELVKQGFIK